MQIAMVLVFTFSVALRFANSARLRNTDIFVHYHCCIWHNSLLAEHQTVVPSINNINHSDIIIKDSSSLSTLLELGHRSKLLNRAFEISRRLCARVYIELFLQTFVDTVRCLI